MNRYLLIESQLALALTITNTRTGTGRPIWFLFAQTIRLLKCIQTGTHRTGLSSCSDHFVAIVLCNKRIAL